MPARRSESRPAAADIKPMPKYENKASTRPEPAADSPSMIARVEARRLADAESVLKSAGIQGFTPIKPLGSGATANVCLCERGQRQAAGRAQGAEVAKAAAIRTCCRDSCRNTSRRRASTARTWPKSSNTASPTATPTSSWNTSPRATCARAWPATAPRSKKSFIIIGSILSALVSVHAGGIIHRDLKPANVMFRDDGTIALVDFGSARRDADPVAKTLAGVVIGTPYYLSPEQALGGTADERSDLYSVGVMLYELLTGQRMYAAASLVALFEMHKNAPIPKLPDELARHQRFLERLVSKKPDERYPTAAEAFAALMEFSMTRLQEPRSPSKARETGTFPVSGRRRGAVPAASFAGRRPA